MMYMISKILLRVATTSTVAFTTAIVMANMTGTNLRTNTIGVQKQVPRPRNVRWAATDKVSAQSVVAVVAVAKKVSRP
jgi:hypothetical protein